MKKHVGKIIALVVALVVVILAVIFGLKGCGGDPSGPSSSGGPTSSGGPGSVIVDEPGSATYTVELKSVGGMVLDDIGVYVYTDSTKSELVWFDRTDEFGMMTFTDKASDSYVAVLEGIPVGYAVEEYYALTGEVTTIILGGALTPYEEAGEFTYSLGSMVYDFTVTTTDGTTYTFSELLQEKKLIVLNFWYTTCEPCKKEFPVIQSVSEQYGEDAIVLCMNPVDGENDKITALMEELGLTLPMAGVGSEWADMLGITAYPTTVVIDRYGMISMMHTGTVTNPEVWETIFSHYTSDSYVQATYDNISILAENLELEAEEEEGSEENPIEVGSANSMTVDVKAGGVTYLTIYKMNNVYLTDKDAYVIYNGKTYEASGGSVTVWLSSDDTFGGMEVGIGNSGSEDKTFTLNFAAKAGSIGSPYKLTLGEFTTNYDAGNEQGIYYTWVAPASGVLTLENVSHNAPNGYGYVLYNLNSYKQNVSENESISIEVMAGQTVQVIISARPVDGFNYPAATIVSKATFVSGEVDTNSYPFAVTVVDDEGNVIPDVTLSANSVDVITDEAGSASFSLKKGAHSIYVTAPNGYQEVAEGIAVEVTGEAETDQLTITLQKIHKHVVRVTDQGGFAVPGAVVKVGTVQAVTNAQGEATLRMVSGEYTVEVIAPNGYVSAADITFDNEKIAAVVLEAAAVPYTVQVTDEAGAPVVGAAVVIPEQKSTLPTGAEVTIPAITVYTDADGVAAYETYLAEHDMTLSCEGYFSGECTVAAGEQTVSAVLYETAAYTIQVLASDGNAVEGVTVYVSETSGITSAVLTGISDETGLITIVAPKNGSYVARVDVALLPDGYAYDSTELPFGEDGTLTITLMNDQIFSILVQDETGAPVSGAQVKFQGVRMENQVVEPDEEGTEGESILVEIPVEQTAQTDNEGKAYFVASLGSSVELTVPDGYRLADGEVESKLFGEATQIQFSLQSLVSYSLTLKDYSDAVVSGAEITAQLTLGELCWDVPFVDGVASIQLDAGEYAVSLVYDAAKYYVETGALTLTPEKTAVSIRVADQFSGEVNGKYYGDLRYVDVGTTYLTLEGGQVNYIALELGDNNPTGYYSFQFYGDAEVYYHGGTMFDRGKMEDYTDAAGVCTVMNTNDVLIGLHADADAAGGVLVVTYVGEKVEIPSVAYDDENYTPAAYTLPTDVTLSTFASSDLLSKSYANPLLGESSDFVEEDGCLYYVSGGEKHQLFINLNWNTMSLTTLLSNGPFNGYFDDDGDGKNDRKEEYTDNLQSYIDCADQQGYYPLNMELLYILYYGGYNQGWWAPNSPTNGYELYFSSLSSIDNAWMTFLAYAD